MPKSFQPATDNARILVVDDEPAIVQALGDYLEANGYQVSLARDGEEAWQKITNEDISLVLTDVMMPGLDGFGLCQRIKKNPATVFLPVVLVTALARTEDRVKGAQAGADDFITKPPDEQELLTRIKSLLRMKALHDALEASNHRLRDVVTERTQQLDDATAELKRLLEEKAHFSSSLTRNLPATAGCPRAG